MSAVLTTFTSIVTFIVSQFTGLFTTITGNDYLYTIILCGLGVSVIGTVCGFLFSFGLKKRRRGRR